MKTFIAALLLLAPLLLLAGCPDHQRECEDKARAGVYLFNQNSACGCAKTVCEGSKICHQGRCCNPKTEDCGCSQSCQAPQVCAKGVCCDPTSASSDENCGCKGPCASGTSCSRAAEGAPYQCACDPTRSFDQIGCGCDPNANCTNQESCGIDSTGKTRCLCEPKKNPNNSANCGCRGPCPGGSVCNVGGCGCKSSEEVLCVVRDKDGKEVLSGTKDNLGRDQYQYRCVRRDECSCDPMNPPVSAQRDPNNCGCKGPCGEGERCVNGACECDPLLNLNNNTRCGCRPDPAAPDDRARFKDCTRPADPISHDDFVCRGGDCICNTSKRFSDSSNCGCPKAFDDLSKLRCDTDTATDAPENRARGEMCVGGVCVCDPELHQFDSDLCGCQGSCNSPTRCRYGRCECQDVLCDGWERCQGDNRCHCSEGDCNQYFDRTDTDNRARCTIRGNKDRCCIFEKGTQNIKCCKGDSGC